MNWKLVADVLTRLIVAVSTFWLSLPGGWHLLWLVIAAPMAASILGLFLPGRSSGPAGRFKEPGQHRVVLQVPGPKTIQVIREVRRTTGLGLREAKEMVDSAPIVVAEGLSEQSAELVADRLRAAGARALAAPIGEM